MAWRLLSAGALFGILAAGTAIGQVPPAASTDAAGQITKDQPNQSSANSVANQASDNKKDRHGRPHDEAAGENGQKRERRFVMERFLMDSVRREGGALELFPLLRVPEVRRELALDEQAFTEKLNAYWSAAQRRAEESRQQAVDKPRDEVAEFIAVQLRSENDKFREFLKELTPDQQDRLLGLFIQAKNYRAVSNQLVASKLGMDEQQAAKMRKEVETIREDTMRETRDRFRRIFENGGDRDQFDKLIRENHQKMDSLIEKALSESQRARLATLRGVALPGPPDWLIRAVDFGRPGPIMPPGAGARPAATAPDIKADSPEPPRKQP